MKVTVSESEFNTPPMDAYYFDLVFIEKRESTRSDWDDYFTWHWRFANVAGQEKWWKQGSRASSTTPLNPTLQNRFGQFLRVLLGGLNKGQEITMNDIIYGKFRVKAFLKHKENKKQPDQPFCNIEDLVPDSVQKGVGCGINGANGKLRETVNIWLHSQGKAPLPELETQRGTQTGATQETAQPVASQPQEVVQSVKAEDIPW